MSNRELWRELKKQNTLKGVMETVPITVPETVSALLLCFLCVIPVMRMIPVFRTYGAYHCMDMYYSNLFVGAAGGVVAIYMLIRGIYVKGEKATIKQFIVVNFLPLCLAAMLIWSIFSCLFSDDLITSFFGTMFRREGLVTYLSYTGIFYLATQVKTRKLMLLVGEVMTASASLMSLVCVIDKPVLYSICEMTKNCGIFYNSNHFGYYLCISTAVCLWVLISGSRVSDFRTGALTVIHYTELALISSALVFCQTRGSLLGIGVGCVLLLVFCFTGKNMRKKRLSAVCAVCFTVVIIILVSASSWDIISDFGAAVSDTSAAISENHESAPLNPVNDRFRLWKQALIFTGERPVFGYGPDNLGMHYSEAGIAGHDRPHNELLQFSASLGIPALLFYVSGFIWLLSVFIKCFKSVDVFTLCLYCTVASYLVSSLFGNTMFYTSPFFFTVLGLCFSDIKSIAASVRQKPPCQICP